MKAIRIHRFGGPEVLQLDDIPRPEPGPGEMLVRVAAASVNPVDYKMRNGGYPRLGEDKLPAGLGRDVAGVAEVIGPGVAGALPGMPVMAHLEWERAGYAEFVVVKHNEFAPKPETLTMLDAGSLPLAAMTAWQGLFDHGALRAGERVLIHGGSGGVGYLAVQFAKIKGAEVFATASADNLDWVKSLGADTVIDYKAQRFEAVAKDIDLVLDLQGGETRARSWGVLKPQGRLITTLIAGDVQAQAAEHGRRGQHYYAAPNAAELREVGQLCNEGRLQVMVDRVFPLEEAGAAQACLENDHPRGKVVLEVR